jgi:DNA-binding response OmpR family regulator
MHARKNRIDQMTSREYALDAFLAKKAKIDTMLARLQALSADHFEASPDDVHWGHVGTLGFYAEQLKRITDAAFKEGEHAE